MYSVELFVGFPVDDSFAKALVKVDPAFKSLYVKEGEGYLREVIFEETRYLGKGLAEQSDLATLELLQDHVMSLLKKLVPDYPYPSNSLCLFPLMVPHAK